MSQKPIIFSPNFFNPHYQLIPTRYPNNFFHKCYSSIALQSRMLFHVQLCNDAMENSIINVLCHKNLLFFFTQIFFNPRYQLIPTRHPNNFFHKCYSSIALQSTMLSDVQLCNDAMENSIINVLSQKNSTIGYDHFFTKIFFQPTLSTCPDSSSK